MNDEYVRIWREMVVAYFKLLSRILVEIMKENLSGYPITRPRLEVGPFQIEVTVT